MAASGDGLSDGFSERKNKKEYFFQKRTGEVVETTGSVPESEPAESENEAEKLLKTRTCGKSESGNCNALTIGLLPFPRTIVA
jgi:hypothetical protein